MIVLTGVQKLKCKLGAAVATVEPEFVASYGAIMGTTWDGLTPVHGQTNGTTEVTIVDQPSGGMQTRRDVKNVLIRNADTATVTLTVFYEDGATERELWSGDLKTGEHWIYDNGAIAVGDGRGDAPAPSEIAETLKTVTTTDATVTTIATLVIPADSTSIIRASVLATKSDHTQNDVWIVAVGVKRQAGNPSFIEDGDPTPGESLFIRQTDSSWKVDWAVSASNILLRVTGDAGVTIQWKAVIEVISEP